MHRKREQFNSRLIHRAWNNKYYITEIWIGYILQKMSRKLLMIDYMHSL